jgi:hypothetical protein
LFTNAASYAYGLIGAAAGFSPTTLMAAAGGYNLLVNPETAGPNFGNNPNNPPFISKGIRDFFDSSYGPPAIIPDNSFQESPTYATPADRFKAEFDLPPRAASDDIDRFATSVASGKITPSNGFTDPTTANPYAGSFPQALDRLTSSARDGWFHSMVRNGEVERIMRDKGVTPPSVSSDNSAAFGGSGKWGSVPTGVAQPRPSDRPESFDNRFGNWGFAPAGDFGHPGSGAPQNYKRSAAPDGPAPTSAQGAFAATPASQPYTAGAGSVLGKFILDSLFTPAEAASPTAQGTPLLTPYFPSQPSTLGDRSGIAPDVPSPDTYPQLRRVSPPLPRMTLPDPDQPVPPQPGGPLGIFTGKPMPSWTVPPPLGGLLDNSNAAGNNDGFNLLARLVARSSTPLEPPPQTAGSIPERRLARVTRSVSPAPADDPRALAAPLVPSDDANYVGGLLGMFTGKPGFDPQSSNQPAPLDDEHEQAELQALEDRLTRTGSINDSWALYKARLASRR